MITGRAFGTDGPPSIMYLDKRISKVQLSSVYTGQSILNWKNEYKAEDCSTA